MADDTKELLAKFSVSTTEFDSAVKKMRELLASLDEEEAQRVEKAKKDTDAALDAQKQQLANIQQMKVQSASAVAEEQKKASALKSQQEQLKVTTVQQKAAVDSQIASEKAKEAAAKAALSAQKKITDAQLAEAKVAAEAAKKQLLDTQNVQRAKALAAQEARQAIQRTSLEESAAHKKRIAEIQEEAAALRLERLKGGSPLEGKEGVAEASATASHSGFLANLVSLFTGSMPSGGGKEKEGEEEGGEKEGGEKEESVGEKFVESATSGLFGGGTVGHVAKNMLMGGGMLAAVDGIAEGMEKLLDTTREFIEDSGHLQKVLDTFQKLSQVRGINSTEFLEGLFKATHRLVPEVHLLRTANTFLQSGMHLSQEQVLKLTEATVGLARANGHDAQDAIDALNRAFLTGRAYTLSYVTGIQRQNMAVGNMGRMTSEATRSQQSFNQVMSVIERRYDAIGQPALTYTDRLHQMKIMTDELFEGMAQGVVKSAGFGVFMEHLGAFIDSLGGLETFSGRVGASLGEFFGVLGTGITVLKDIYSSLVHTNEGVKELGEASDEVTPKIIRPFQAVHLFARTSIESMMGLREQYLLFASDIRLVGDVLDRIQYKISSVVNRPGKSRFHHPGVSKLFPQMGMFEGAEDEGQAHPPAPGKTLSQSFSDYNARNKDIASSTQVKGNKYLAQLAKEYATGSGSANDLGKDGDPALAYRIAEANASARLQAKKKLASNELEIAKAEIEQEQEATERQYQAGTLTAEKYYAKKKELAQKTFEATKSYVNADVDAEQQYLRKQVMFHNVAPSTAKLKSAGLETDRHTRIAQAAREEDKVSFGTSEAQQKDAEAARIKMIQRDLEVKKEALAEEKAGVEYAYQQQLISAEAYSKARIDLIRKGVEAERVASQEILANQKDTLAGRIETLENYRRTLQQASLQTEEIENSSPQEQYQQSGRRFEEEQGVLQSRLAISETGPKGQKYAGGSPQSIAEQLNSSYNEQIQQLQTMLSTITPYSELWNQIYQDILKATQAQGDFNTQLQQMQSNLPAVSQVFGSFGQQLSGSFGSHFARGLESTFGGVSQQFAMMPSLVDALSGGKIKQPQDPAIKKVVDSANQAGQGLQAAMGKTSTSFDAFTQSLAAAKNQLVQQLDALSAKIASVTGGAGGSPTVAPLGGNTSAAETLANIQSQGGAGLDTISQSQTAMISGGSTGIMSSLGGAFSSIFKSVKGLAGPQGFSNLSKVTDAVVNSFGSFMNTITNSGSASSGAFGGAAGGAGLGSGISQSFGLTGAAAGGVMGGMAAAGLVTGMISGQKQENVVDDINKLNLAYKGIMDNYSSNNQSLQATIDSMRQLIQQAQVEMAQSKKGSSQFTQLINQYNEQINQLQDQAKQTITKMREQLDVLSSPTQFQSLFSSIQQVLDQYAQFAGAAQNAHQLAQANQFLKLSMEQLSQGYANQLLQNEETAVSDALQLNQLLNQRNQLQYQYIQQVESIQGQGTITRNQTLAQSKFSQLYQANVNHTNQMMQINEQIAVEQQKVSAESKIFQLAQDRQGLESQMVALQTQSITLDMARISAMKNLLDTLKGTGYSITNLAGVNASNPNQMILQLLQQLIGQTAAGSTGSNPMASQINQILGAMGNSTSATDTSGATLSGLSASAYSHLSGMGLGSFRGQNL